MKKTYALLLLCSTAFAVEVGDAVTLDIKVGETSAYEDYVTNVSGSSITSPYLNSVNDQVAKTLTFYIKAADMYSTSDVTSTTQYVLNSLSLAINTNNHYYDGGRQMQVKNLTTSATCLADYPDTIDSTTHITTLTFGEGVIFGASDILEVTISSTNAGEDVALIYTDRKARTSYCITGATSDLINGEMNYTDYSKHTWHTNKYNNAPVVRLGVTVAPEPATATLSLLALAALASRRKRH